MTSPRLDVSVVPLQGGYTVQQCPVVIQNRMLVPDREVSEEAADAVMRKHDGIDFEATLVATMADAAGWTLVGDALRREEAQEFTAEAMAAGARVIHNAYLPPDEQGRRTGRPDLLIAVGDGYIPIDVKHRLKLREADGQVLVSDIDSPRPDTSYLLDGHVLRPHEGEALQLAHYRRMLEAMGYASNSTLAGIVGKEQVVVWYDLDEPMWSTPSTSDPARKKKLRSTLEHYDFEFGWRLDIAATAMGVGDQRSGELLVEPMWCGECGECGFLEYCSETLDAGTGDTSKIPGNTFDQWKELRAYGIRERGQVAALHYPTAALVRHVELGFFLDAANGHSSSTPIEVLRPRAKKQLEALKSAGIHTVGDLEQLDGLTARFGGSLANRILDARAALGSHPVYRRPGESGDSVPRADIEIDIDMENMNEGVYLWGTFLTDRVGSGLFAEGYRGFATWDPINEEAERQPFLEVWDWLGRQISAATRQGLTLKAYVWHESAENSQLRRIARSVGAEATESVEATIASDSWVDLRKVFDASWMTGGSSGLKAIAPLSGYSWPVDDPGGGLAMARYVEAVTDDSAEARQWILDYNRGDVEATLSIREWLDSAGSSWPEVPTD